MTVDDRPEPSWLGDVRLEPIDLGLTETMPTPSGLLLRRSTWCLIAGVALGALAPGRPTAVAAVDVVLKGVVAAAFVLGASRARRAAVMISALIVVMAAVIGSVLSHLI